MSSTKPGRTLETSLYAAVKAHLERLGYEAKGEVCGCDIVAVRPGEPPFLVITELKLGLTLELILQGVDRLAAADEVWLAVRATRRGRDRDGRAHKLCRLLGFGLLAVDPARRLVEVLAEPGPTGRGQTPSAGLSCSANTSAGAAIRPSEARRGSPS
ncbi:hypothetical protein [Dankookia sp. P2]|uniref:hypothetical protein n=1 Tax=Dankookia sp. P2 TaxID=3423955 RepID=UPI003D677660